MTHQQSTEAVPDTAACRNLTAKSARMRNSDGTVDRTDGDSSSSSFYSSFFKTESGSAEDSGDKLGAKLRVCVNFHCVCVILFYKHCTINRLNQEMPACWVVSRQISIGPIQ